MVRDVMSEIHSAPSHICSIRDFDKLMTNRSSEAPPPIGNGIVAVECNGYAAGRGSGWVSFQGATRGVAKGSQEGHHQVLTTSDQLMRIARDVQTTRCF